MRARTSTTVSRLLATALLTIRRTKFYKTRLVPIGPDLCGAMRHYAEQHRGDAAQAPGSAFFRDRHGRPLREGTVRRAFAQLRGTPTSSGPTVHGINRVSMICGMPSPVTD